MMHARTENARKNACSSGWPNPLLTEETNTTRTNSLTSSTPYDLRRARRTSTSPKLPPRQRGSHQKSEENENRQEVVGQNQRQITHCVHATTFQPYHHSKEGAD